MGSGLRDEVSVGREGRSGDDGGEEDSIGVEQCCSVEEEVDTEKKGRSSMTYNTVQCMYAVLLDNERNANRSALYQWGRAAAEDLMLSDNCHHRRSSQSRKEPMLPESRTALDARR